LLPGTVTSKVILVVAGAAMVAMNLGIDFGWILKMMSEREKRTASGLIWCRQVLSRTDIMWLDDGFAGNKEGENRIRRWCLRGFFLLLLLLQSSELLGFGELGCVLS